MTGLLLDTHVWLRAQGMSGPLRPSTLTAIDRAAHAGLLFVTPTSVWEIAMLVKRGRIRLDVSIEQWVREALSKPGISLLDFSADIAIDAANLPEPMHKDPADRIIVASARVERLMLVTRDKEILQFARLAGLAHMQA